MSQRASFVTEYIYCVKCADALEGVLCAEKSKGLCAVRIPTWTDPGVSVEGGGRPPALPIIAGKVGGLYIGKEYHTFEFGPLREEIERALCHPVLIVVLGDGGAPEFRAYLIQPQRPA